MIPLFLLLAALMMPSIEGSKDMAVVFVEGAPSGDEIRGRACGPSLIAPGDEPNPLCLGLPGNPMIIYHDVIDGPKYAGGNDFRFRYWLADTLAHEACHLSGELTEPPCYLAGQNYAWEMVRQMKGRK